LLFFSNFDILYEEVEKFFNKNNQGRIGKMETTNNLPKRHPLELEWRDRLQQAYHIDSLELDHHLGYLEDVIRYLNVGRKIKPRHKIMDGDTVIGHITDTFTREIYVYSQLCKRKYNKYKMWAYDPEICLDGEILIFHQTLTKHLLWVEIFTRFNLWANDADHDYSIREGWTLVSTPLPLEEKADMVGFMQALKRYTKIRVGALYSKIKQIVN